MARTKLEIDPKKFQQEVNKLEKDGPFPTRNDLWAALAETEWSKGLKPRPLTAPVAYQRSREFGTKCKTPLGKRGGKMTKERIEKMQAGRTGRTPRKEKLAAFGYSFEEMLKQVPENYHNDVKKAQEGSLRAALKLKCLDCVCWQPEEIRQCACFACGLYPHRPFKAKPEEEKAKLIQLGIKVA